MRWIAPLILSLVIAAAAATTARATLQAESCWEPDIEYPVPCEDDED